jgi:hypothetical protein
MAAEDGLTTWLAMLQNLVGEPIRFARRESDWVIDVGEVVGFCVGCFWRLVTDEGIVVSSEDDGHLFGLPAPVDAERDANRAVLGETLIAIKMHRATADLRFTLTSGVVIEVITTSRGYESWQAYDRAGQLQAVGGNGGLR